MLRIVPLPSIEPRILKNRFLHMWIEFVWFPSFAVYIWSTRLWHLLVVGRCILGYEFSSSWREYLKSSLINNSARLLRNTSPAIIISVRELKICPTREEDEFILWVSGSEYKLLCDFRGLARTDIKLRDKYASSSSFEFRNTLTCFN